MRPAITRLRVVCVLAALASAPLAGCGGDDDGKPAASGTTPTVADPAAAPADEQHDRGNGSKGNGKGGGKGGGPPDEAPADAVGMEGVAEPTSVAPSSRPVAKAVERELGEKVDTGQRTVIGASCKGDRCLLRFRVAPKGGGAVSGAVEGVAARVFRADAAVDRIVIYVHHKQNAPHKDERAAFYAATCRRGEGGTASCKGTKAAAGKQRNEIRRKKLDVDDASRGRGG